MAELGLKDKEDSPDRKLKAAGKKIPDGPM